MMVAAMSPVFEIACWIAMALALLGLVGLVVLERLCGVGAFRYGIVVTAVGAGMAAVGISSGGFERLGSPHALVSAGLLAILGIAWFRLPRPSGREIAQQVIAKAVSSSPAMCLVRPADSPDRDGHTLLRPLTGAGPADVAKLPRPCLGSGCGADGASRRRPE